VEIDKLAERIPIPLGTSEHRHLGADADAQPDGRNDQGYPGNHHRDEETAVGSAAMKVGGITFAASLKACHYSLTRAFAQWDGDATSISWAVSIVDYGPARHYGM
jgi:hypothetical protein